MNILIITGTTQSSSGLGRYSREVIKQLQEQGEYVTVAAESGECDVSLERRSGLFSFFVNLFRVRNIAKNADIVHALDAWPFAVYGVAGVFGRTTRLYVSGLGTYALPPSRLSLKRSLLLYAYKRARHIFVISSYTKKRVEERLPFRSALSVVHMGDTLLPRPSTESIEQMRSRYRIDTAHPVILTVGEIKDRKGQLETMQAVLQMRNKFPHAIYVMVGGDSDRAYIERIRDTAHSCSADEPFRIVADARSDVDIATWYSIADVFVLASNNDGDHFEGFGLVFLEAGQFGVPGVGTRGCGIEDAVVDGSTGALVPQRDPQAIADAIDRVLEHREEFGSAARKFADSFSWHSTVEAYRRAYYS